MQEIKQKTGRDALSTAYFGTMYRNRDINNCIQRFRACLKNHSRNLHAPLCGIFCPNSVVVARYDALIRTKSPTNCDAHLAESLFQTRSGAFLLAGSCI